MNLVNLSKLAETDNFGSLPDHRETGHHIANSKHRPMLANQRDKPVGFIHPVHHRLVTHDMNAPADKGLCRRQMQMVRSGDHNNFSPVWPTGFSFSHRSEIGIASFRRDIERKTSFRSPAGV